MSCSFMGQKVYFAMHGFLFLKAPTPVFWVLIELFLLNHIFILCCCRGREGW